MSENPEEFDIEMKNTEELIPYVNNPKKHPKEQIDKIASSIKNFEWDQPIVVDEEMEIIKGHGRLKAAEKLGYDKVPVIVRDDLTKEEARAARISDNRTAESEWNDELLRKEMDSLKQEMDDLEEATGFGQHEIENLIGEEDINFEPERKEEQGNLDEAENSSEVECPECGHVFDK